MMVPGGEPRTIMVGMRSFSQRFVRLLLGCFMVFAGAAHLTFARQTFLAQVPAWLPLNPDFVVLASGMVELGFGFALLLAPQRYRRGVAVALAVFYVLIFPGNINQYVQGIDAFGLDTDTKRLVRLLFQPILVIAALWAGGVPGEGKIQSDANGENPYRG